MMLGRRWVERWRLLYVFWCTIVSMFVNKPNAFMAKWLANLFVTGNLQVHQHHSSWLLCDASGVNCVVCLVIESVSQSAVSCCLIAQTSITHHPPTTSMCRQWRDCLCSCSQLTNSMMLPHSPSTYTFCPFHWCLVSLLAEHFNRASSRIQWCAKPLTWQWQINIVSGHHAVNGVWPRRAVSVHKCMPPYDAMAAISNWRIVHESPRPNANR